MRKQWMAFGAVCGVLVFTAWSVWAEEIQVVPSEPPSVLPPPYVPSQDLPLAPVSPLSRPSLDDVHAEQERVVRRLVAASEEAAARGDLQEAEIRLYEARGLAPDNGLILFRLAQLHVLRRQYLLAEDELLLIVEGPFNNPDAGALLGGVWIRLGRFDEATRMLDEVLKERPDLLVARFHRVCLDIVADQPRVARLRLQGLSLQEYGQLLAWLAQDMNELWSVLNVNTLRNLSGVIVHGGAPSTRGTRLAFLDEADPQVWQREVGGMALAIRGLLDAIAQDNPMQVLSAIQVAQQRGALSPLLAVEEARWEARLGGEKGP